MSFSYPYPNCICNIADSLDFYLRANLDSSFEYSGINTYPTTVLTQVSLTDTQLTELTPLMNAYTDPAVWLTFDSTSISCLHSHWNTDTDNSIVYEGTTANVIPQTFIYSVLNQQINSTVLDGLKTIVEYNCPNVQNYLNTTSGSIYLEIYDITRDTQITYQNIDISDIASTWNTLAQTGSTVGNTIYKTVQYSGLMNQNPSYDVIWQLRTNNGGDSKFIYRCNCMQYLYYQVQTSSS